LVSADQPWKEAVDHETATPPLIQTKLHRPRISRDLIDRSHLLEHLNARGSDRFGEMSVNTEVAADGSTQTVLTGWLVDQAALFGVFDGLCGPSFPLVSVECLRVNHAT
jgi:hypothetical protein